MIENISELSEIRLRLICEKLDVGEHEAYRRIRIEASKRKITFLEAADFLLGLHFPGPAPSTADE